MAEADIDIAPEADREAGLAHPRDNFDLFGQDAIDQSVANAINSGRLHHAWLITGPKGVGKATLAYRIVRRVLGASVSNSGLHSDAEDPISRQISALSHPDFLLVRRAYDSKKNKHKSEITVDETRRVASFFSQSASQDGWRVCLIDAADEMNTNAANALLKTLEEPPRRCLLILIAHVPGRLPVTIRSRCRRLALRAPDEVETQKWLVDQHSIDQNLAQQSSALTLGAPGRALVLAQSGVSEIKADLDQILSKLPSLDRARLNAFAAQLAVKGQEQTRSLILEFMSAYARQKARDAAMNGQSEASSQWVRCRDDLARLIIDADRIYLDPKQTILEAFFLVRDCASKTRV